MAITIPFLAVLFAVFMAHAQHEVLVFTSTFTRRNNTSPSQIQVAEGAGKFQGFLSLCKRARLSCKEVEEVKEFDVDVHYHHLGLGTKPVVVRGAARGTRAIDRWKDRSYLRQIFDHYTPDMESVITSKIFIRGTDAFMGQDPLVTVERGTSWLFGDRAKVEKGSKYVLV